MSCLFHCQSVTSWAYGWGGSLRRLKLTTNSWFCLPDLSLRVGIWLRIDQLFLLARWVLLPDPVTRSLSKLCNHCNRTDKAYFCLLYVEILSQILSQRLSIRPLDRFIGNLWCLCHCATVLRASNSRLIPRQILNLDTSVLGLHWVEGIEMPGGLWSSVYGLGRFCIAGHRMPPVPPPRAGLLSTGPLIWGEQALRARAKITAHRSLRLQLASFVFIIRTTLRFVSACGTCVCVCLSALCVCPVGYVCVQRSVLSCLCVCLVLFCDCLLKAPFVWDTMAESKPLPALTVDLVIWIGLSCVI